MAQRVNNLSAMQKTQEMQVQFLGWEAPLEKDMATHPSILAWKMPWTEEPGGLHTGPWSHKKSAQLKQLNMHTTRCSEYEI